MNTSGAKSKSDITRAIGIDPGLNNWLSCVSNIGTPEAFEVDLSQDETLEAMTSHRPGSPSATLAVAQKVNGLRQLKGLPPLIITIDDQPINLEGSK
jgi:hypothetical protein